jgi:glycosyltransferase involved in cell wall biosynthesis
VVSPFAWDRADGHERVAIAVTGELSSVLLVTPLWTRDGGIGTHVMASAEALAQRGCDVHVLAARLDSQIRVAGVTLHDSPRLLDTSASIQTRVGTALARIPAAVHLHQLHDPQLVAHMQSSAPLVISAHGFTACTSGVHYFGPGEECTRQHGPGCVPNLLARGCAHTRDPRWFPAAYRRATRGRDALRRCDMAISYSTAMDRHLAVNGVRERSVIPLFPTLTPVEGSGHATRRRVVFAGRVVQAKGVDVLLRAAGALDAELVICGDGWGLDSMRKLARKLAIAERVDFKGWRDPQQLARELAEASVVVVPSVWPEPFGLVGIEALACGRPVVASATGGIVDWLEHGVNGLSFAAGDSTALAHALNELLDDPSRQAEMGAAGRRMVAERFSRERHASALQAAYRSASDTWRSRMGRSPAAA